MRLQIVPTTYGKRSCYILDLDKNEYVGKNFYRQYGLSCRANQAGTVHCYESNEVLKEKLSEHTLQYC